MSEHAAPTVDELPLYDVVDDAGREWLDEIVRLFNDGAYGESVDAHLTSEAASPGHDA